MSPRLLFFSIVEAFNNGEGIVRGCYFLDRWCLSMMLVENSANEISQPRCYSILFVVPINNRINHETFISSNKGKYKFSSLSLCGRLKIHLGVGGGRSV